MLKKKLRIPLALGMLAATVSLVAPSVASQSAQAATTPATLEPAAGQYLPVPEDVVLDTRSSIGGSQGGIPANSSLSVAVGGTGVGADGLPLIPNAGVTAVLLNIEVLSAASSGYLSDFETGDTASTVSSVSFTAGLGTSGTDQVSINESTGDGEVTFANHSSGVINLAVGVEGYWVDGNQETAGDTFVPSNWSDILDTRSGLGTGPSAATGTNLGNGTTGGPVGAIAAGATIYFSAFTSSGSPWPSATGQPLQSSDVDAVEFTVGALQSSGYGWLSFAGLQNNLTDDNGNQLRSMTYQPGEKNRETDILQPSNGSNGVPSGMIAITNDGSQSVDIQVAIRGYFITPSTVDVAGDTYVPFNDPSRLCDSAQSGGCVNAAGVVFSTIPKNGSETIAELGSDGLPTTGVGAVAEEVDAISPQQTGYLTVTPAGQSETFTEAYNFTAGQNDDLFDNNVDAVLGTNGDVTITNYSSGTVEISITVRGYWQKAQVPGQVPDVLSSYWNGEATIAWESPTEDGGTPIQNYIVSDLTSGATTNVSGNVNEVMIPASDLDQVQVTAQNLVNLGVPSIPISDDGGSSPGANSSESPPVPLNANVLQATPEQLSSWGLPPMPDSSDPSILAQWQSEVESAQGEEQVSPILGTSDSEQISTLQPTTNDCTITGSCPISASNANQSNNYTGYQMRPIENKSGLQGYYRVSGTWIQPSVPTCKVETGYLLYTKTANSLNPNTANPYQQCFTPNKTNEPSDWSASASGAFWIGIADQNTIAQMGCTSISLYKSASQYRCWFENFDSAASISPTFASNSVQNSPSAPYTEPDVVFHGLIVRPGNKVTATMWIDHSAPPGRSNQQSCPSYQKSNTNTTMVTVPSTTTWAHYSMTNVTTNTHTTMNQALCWVPSINDGTVAEFIMEGRTVPVNTSNGLQLWGKPIPNFGSVVFSHCYASYASNYPNNGADAGPNSLRLSSSDSDIDYETPDAVKYVNSLQNVYFYNAWVPTPITTDGGFTINWNQNDPGGWDPLVGTGSETP